MEHVHRGVWAAVLVAVTGSIGFSISFTYLALYFNTVRGLSMMAAGTIIFISGMLSGVFQVIGGALADRFGHRKMLFVYLLLQLSALLVLTILIATESVLWVVIIFSVLVPMTSGPIMATHSAIIADFSQDTHLAESFGLVAIADNIGWAIGPLAGGYLLKTGSYAWLFGVALLVDSISLVGVALIPKSSDHPDPERLSFNTVKSLLGNSTLVIFSIISVTFFLVMAQWGSTLSVFTIDRVGFSTEEYGWLMAISGILIVVFQHPISRRLEWLGLRKALVLGCVFYGVGFLLFSWFDSFLPATLAVVIIVIGEMLFMPSVLAAVGRMSKPEDRGKNMGFFGLFSTLGISLGPLLGGFLLDRYPASTLALWGTIAFMALLGATGFTVWKGYLHMYEEQAV